MTYLRSRKAFRPPYPIETGPLVYGALVYLVAWAFCAAIPWLYGIAPESIYSGSIRPDGITLLGVMVLLGGMRAVRSHPALHPSYGKWLALTPWEHPMPLPLGSPQLERRDLLLLGTAAAAAHWGSHLNPLLPLIVFSIAYLLPSAVVLFDRGARPAACGIVFGLAAVVRLWPAYLFVAALVAGLHVLAYMGLAVSLREFGRKGQDQPDMRRTVRTLGSPFAQLNPAAPPDPISPRHACLVALLAGWWAYCVAAPADTAGQGREAFGVATMVGLVVALGRFAIYAVGIQPPAGFFGRIGSGRWVIAGYDRVLLAPLCITLLTLFAGIGGYLAALNWGVSFAVLSGGTVGLVLLLGIGLGPTLRDWRLCGECTFLRNTRSGLRREPRTSGAGDDSRPGGGFETSWVSVQS